MRLALAMAFFVISAVPGAVRGGDEAGSTGAAARTVVAGPEYRAGGFHRWLWGTDYRPLWTAPIPLEVLDLQHFAGGLKPVMRVGGQETKGLAMKGADGRDYTFRGLDKDPVTILPEDLRDTWVRGLVQDQIAANHPASFFVVDELMKAAGILRTEQLIRVRSPTRTRASRTRPRSSGTTPSTSASRRTRRTGRTRARS
jgi:hypothetical protein